MAACTILLSIISHSLQKDLADAQTYVDFAFFELSKSAPQPFFQTGIRIASHHEKKPFTVGKVGIPLNMLEEDLLILLWEGSCNRNHFKNVSGAINGFRIAFNLQMGH